MYVIKRHNSVGKTQYLCNDSARTFWLSRADKVWLKAVPTEREATDLLEQTKANNITGEMLYLLIYLWLSASVMIAPFILLYQINQLI